MILIKIQGGLGNQMFQYALAKKIGLLKKVPVKFDISWFNNFGEKTAPRHYNLPKFNIIENIATDKEIKKFQRHYPHFSKIGKFYNFLFSDSSKYFKEKNRNFDSSILNLNDNVCLDGFWQSEKYFKNIENIIRTEFTLKEESENFIKLKENILKRKNSSIAIHVRRGDYIRDPQKKERHTVLPTEYYTKSLEIIKEKIPNPYFFIFSDDIEWCKQYFNKLDNVYFVDDKNLKDYEELITMSKCKHQIIANSSFSWWGAWLNPNLNKIVIAPKNYFNNPKIKVNINDRFPRKWIKVYVNF